MWISNSSGNYITCYLHTAVAGSEDYRIGEQVERPESRVGKRVINIEMIAAAGKVRDLGLLFLGQLGET